MSNIFIKVLFFLSIIFFWSCGHGIKKDKKERNIIIKKNISITSFKKGQKIILGNDISIKLKHHKGVKIDSFQFKVMDTILHFMGDSAIINSSFAKIGVQKVNLKAFYQERSENTYTSLVFLPNKKVESYTFKIVKQYNHDEKSYTQGLFFMGDTIVESTGQYGYSGIKKLNLKTGEIYQEVFLDSKYFGEGSTIWNDRIYQITWKSKIAFVYNRKLEKIQELLYQTDGWGLATFQDQIILSDGTEKVYFLNPEDFSTNKVLQIYKDSSKLEMLNELEVFDDKLYANIYGKDEVVIIDLVSGQVVGKIDFTGLIDRNKYAGSDYALNGIAINSKGAIFVTAKWYPKIFEVRLIKKKK